MVEGARGRERSSLSDLTLDKRILTEAANEGLFSDELRRACVETVKAALGVSERRACRVLGQHRSTQRKKPRSLDGAGHDNGSSTFRSETLIRILSQEAVRRGYDGWSCRYADAPIAQAGPYSTAIVLTVGSLETETSFWTSGHRGLLRNSPAARKFRSFDVVSSR
jgi:hypothetical protein